MKSQHPGYMSRTEIVFEPALYFQICCNLLHSLVVNELFDASSKCFLFHVAYFVSRDLSMIEHARLNQHFSQNSYIANRIGIRVHHGQYHHHLQTPLCTHSPPPRFSAPSPCSLHTQNIVPKANQRPFHAAQWVQ